MRVSCEEMKGNIMKRVIQVPNSFEHKTLRLQKYVKLSKTANYSAKR